MVLDILNFIRKSFKIRRDALKEQFGKEPNRVSCLAVKSALLGTRHPRKEKEAALQTVTGKPACLDGKILMSTQSEKEPWQNPSHRASAKKVAVGTQAARADDLAREALRAKDAELAAQRAAHLAELAERSRERPWENQSASTLNSIGLQVFFTCLIAYGFTLQVHIGYTAS